METKELIEKYKKRLQNQFLDDETKVDLRKKIEALERTQKEEKAKESKKETEKEVEEVDDEAIKERIEELKDLINSPLPDAAKRVFKKELEGLEGRVSKKAKPSQKPKAKPKKKEEVVKKPIPVAKPKPKVEQKPKPKPKPKVEEKPKPKPKVKRKVVRGKPEKPKVTPKPKVEAKPKTKVVKKVEKTKPIPKRAPKKVVLKKKPKPQKVYEPKVKTLAGEPDCDTLLKQFRARRRKSKEAQKKRKTTPIFRKISVDVVDAVEKAIKNVPAQQIKESPKETIRKFGVLKKLAQDFLNAFKDVLGKEFDKSEAKKELDELTILIDKLNKKYTSKK
jgi:hypothetical protein